jgi:hypothetical protein
MTQETNKSQQNEGLIASPPHSTLPRFTLNVLAKRSNDSLITEGWMGDKPLLATITEIT